MNRITGKNLHLRDIQPCDRELLIYWLHPHHEWHKFNGPYYPPTPEDKIPSIIDRGLSKDVPEIRERLAIVGAQTDTVMGTVTRYWISEETNWLAIGIVIYDSQNWGKGYGYEALGMWCEYLFKAESKLVRLDLRTWSGNFGMIKLAEKLGFTREATFRDARIVDRKYYDGLGYGILRKEWKESYPQGFDYHLIHS